MRIRVLGPVAALVALALPGAAQAATRCVPAMAPGCDASDPTITTAVTNAGSGDTIRVAAGNYAENVDAGAKRLNFVGAGAGTLTSDAGATVISPAGGVALSLPSGGSVTALKARGGTGGGAGVRLVPAADGSYVYRITDVIGIGGTSDNNEISGGNGLQASSAGAAKILSVTVTRGAFGGPDPPSVAGVGASMFGPGLTYEMLGTTLSGGSAGPATALRSGNGAHGTLLASRLSGVRGVLASDGLLELTRSRVTAQGDLGVSVASFDAPAQVNVTDSLVTAEPTNAGFEGYALQAIVNSDAAVMVNARGSTVVAGGADPDAAVEAEHNVGAGHATIALTNSVARLLGPAEADEGDLVARGGQSITAGSSSFNTVSLQGGGSAPAPGSGTNVAGDPLLAADFSLLPGSPLIDRGDPAAVAAGELDLAGAPRAQDGNGDCSALPDVGAFERAGLPCPNAAPTLAAVSMSNKVFAPVRKGGHITAKKKRKVKRGTRFRYTLSEPARVSIVIERALRGRVKGKGKKRKCVRPTRRNRKAKRCTRYKRVTTLRANEQAGKQSTAFTGRVKRKALKPGRYRARITATDSQGAKSKQRRLAFRIVRG